MKHKTKVFLSIIQSFVIATILTYISLSYESTYNYYSSQSGYSLKPSWGFPFQYVFDNEVSSPAHGISFTDTIKIFPLLGNIFVYFTIFYCFLFKKKSLQTSLNCLDPLRSLPKRFNPNLFPLRYDKIRRPTIVIENNY